MSVPGFLIRSNIRDTVDIFEVNRKECARLLLEYPKWCVSGTFKPGSGAPPTEEDPNAKNWQLESVVVEASSIISSPLLNCSHTSSSLDDPRLVVPPSRVAPQVNLLYCIDHRALQTLAVYRWSSGRQVYQKIVQYTWRWTGP